jgi:hypothetical protein
MIRIGIRSTLALAILFAAGCVTAITETDLEDRLERAAASVSGLGRARIVPIYADTRTVAWGMLTEAKMDRTSPLSVRTGKRLAGAARQGRAVVAGGPYPALTDQILRNALALHQEEGLPGLRLVVVSAEQPSAELRKAASGVRARLYHRDLP